MIGNVDYRVHHDQISGVIDECIFVMDVFDQNTLAILVIVAADSGISRLGHEPFNFVAASAASCEDERLREHRVKLRGAGKPFKPNRSAREKEIVQREAIEKINVG